MVALDTFERYLVEEFYDDYRVGLITRRVFTRRVACVSLAASDPGLIPPTPPINSRSPRQS